MVDLKLTDIPEAEIRACKRGFEHAWTLYGDKELRWFSPEEIGARFKYRQRYHAILNAAAGLVRPPVEQLKY